MISQNTAYYGGGINCYDSSPILKENTIISNSAEDGEDLYCEHFSFPIIYGNNTLDPNKTFYDRLSYATQRPINPWGEIYDAALFEGTSVMGIDLCIEGDYAYFINHESTLQVLYLPDPNNPVIADLQAQLGASAETEIDPNHAHLLPVTDIALDANHAYITNEIAGLMVIDIHDPHNPSLIAEMPQLGRANGISPGDYAYIADALKGLCIVNIAQRDTLEMVSSLDVQGTPYALCIKGDLVYMVNGKGLVIVECSDPENPYITGGVETPGEAQGICLSGDGHLAYIADGEQGLQIIDCLDPYSPKIHKGLNILNMTSTLNVTSASIIRY